MPWLSWQRGGTTDSFTVVLDYGKSVDVDLAQVADSFCLGTDKVVTYMGAKLSGANGTVGNVLPFDLQLDGKGTGLVTETHRFDMISPTVLRFTPKTIMDQPRVLYAVFRVKSTVDVNYETRYITKAICFTPASSIYYETDFDTGIHHIDRTDSLLVHFGADDNTEWGLPARIENYAKSNGVLSGTITGGDPYIQMTNRPENFHYIVKPSDVVKVRIKVAAGTGTNLQVFFMTETNENPTGGISTGEGSFTADGNWHTVTLPIFRAVVGKTVRALRIDPVSNYTKNGTFEVDWIYIGPDVDTEPYLVTGFDANDYSAWLYNSAATTVSKDTVNGYLTGEIKGNDPYIYMTKDTRRYGYRVKEGDTVRVRVKSDAGTGTGFQVYFFTDENPIDAADEYMVDTMDYTPNGEWQTVEISMAGVVGREIRGLRLDFAKNGTFKNSGTYTVDWVYIGPKEEVQKPVLIEFDDKDGIDWAAKQHITGLTKANGVIKGTISGDDPYFLMTDRTSTLNYTLKDTDVVKVRIRSDAGTGIGLDAFFVTDVYAGTTARIRACNGNYVPNGRWQTVTLHILDTAVGATISGLRLDPMYNDSLKEYEDKGTFEYDWVYVGPDIDLEEVGDNAFAYTTASEGTPWQFKGSADASTAKPQLSNSATTEPTYSGNCLFFGFGNSGADQAHYNATYGNRNYDDPNAIATNYYTSTNKDAHQTSITIDNVTGTLELKAVKGPDTGDCAWFDTVSGNYSTWPLNYKPTDAEIIQIRFKMEGFQLSAGRAYPYFKIQYFDERKVDVMYDVPTSPIPLNYLSNGEYITATIPLTDGLGQTFRQKAAITKLRIFFGNILCLSGATGKITIDYLYIGPKNGITMENKVYGYDASYDGMGEYSGDSSLFTVGTGLPGFAYGTDAQGNEVRYIDYGDKTYNEVSFPFIGTGLDIISRTGETQGTIRVVVCDGEGIVQKTVTINLKGETELYQIPVASLTGLPHGSYTAHIFINSPYINDNWPQLNRFGDFYFDGVRIYDTVNTYDSRWNTVYEVYQQHGEADPTFKELRDILIDAGKGVPNGTIDGMVYLDIDEGTGITSIGKYESSGPKNEVYLKSNDSVVFKLEVNGRIPASIQVGAKSADGSTVKMTVGVGATVDAAKSGGPTWTIGTATAQFYPLNIQSSLWQSSENTKYVYVMIRNSGSEGILSITHMKYAYDVPRTEAALDSRMVRFTVDPIMVARLLAPCSHEWDEGTVIDTPDCTRDGKIRYTCGLCEESYTQPLPARGHAYVYTTDSGDCHSVTCSSCDYCVRESHVYMDKVCVCGEPDPRAPMVETNWKLGHTLNLTSDISVNLVVSKALLAGFDMDTVYLVAEIDLYNGNEEAGVRTLKLLPTDQGNYYYFTITGLTAVHMNDRIRSVLHGTKDGQEYYSPTDTYSIADYAYSQLNKESATASLKTLCADLLRYGGKAQLYKNYRTGVPADHAMTDLHRAYLTDLGAVTFGTTNCVLSDVEEPHVRWIGKSLNLDSKVELKFIFALESYTGDPADLTLGVAYTDSKGNDKAVTVDHWEVYDADRGYYAFTLDTLLAAELRCVVSAQIFAGETPVSATLQYAADTYGNNKTGALGDLCRALFAYSDSAKAYFA